MSKLQDLINDGLDAAKRFIAKILPSSKHLLDIAYNIVNGIKTFDDAHPEVANFLTSIIPGTADDVIKDKVRQYLPAVFVRLKWAKDEAGKTPDEIVADAAAFIQTLPLPERAVALQAIWQLLSNELTQDGVSISDLQRIGQVYHDSVVAN